MGIFRYFERELRDVKHEIRRRIEEQAEFVFEEERENGYVECMLEICDDVEIMTHEQKESLRLECLRELNVLRREIESLWEKQIDRTARFQVGTNIFILVGLIATALMFIFGYYNSAIFSITIIVAVIMISKINALYSQIMYFFTATWAISDQLLVTYNKYGRTEAALKLADWRDFSKNITDERKWIFSTTHKVEAPSD